VKERRNKLRRLMLLEYKSQEDLAVALRVTSRTIRFDIKALEKDKEKEPLIDAETQQIMKNFILRKKERINVAWMVFASADNSSSKVGALKLIDDMENKIIEVLQSTGFLKSVAPELKPIEFILGWEHPYVKDVKNEIQISTVGSTDQVPPEPNKV